MSFRVSKVPLCGVLPSIELASSQAASGTTGKEAGRQAPDPRGCAGGLTKLELRTQRAHWSVCAKEEAPPSVLQPLCLASVCLCQLVCQGWMLP